MNLDDLNQPLNAKAAFSLFDEKKIPYCLFLADVVSFLILAAVLFVFIVKFLGWIMKTKAAEEAAPEPTGEEKLLTEIRDLLKARA